MGRTDEKVGYQQKSSHPGITPDIAASGVEEALKVLEGRWKQLEKIAVARG
jgi:ATP-dependent protease Clp ATPase subunit